MNRIDRNEYYLNIADAVSRRSTCLRRRFGAVIVKNDEIIAAGYNGAPRGRATCMDNGICARADVPHGQRYELCRSVHAEENCIISAARRDMIGSTLYLMGKDGADALFDAQPCLLCERRIINAGIEKLVCRNADGTWRVIMTDSLTGTERADAYGH
ncbi:cytidine deaminase [Clostridia bacterium]|nr:cytidine deaminase [Clostridia bacterium]